MKLASFFVEGRRTYGIVDLQTASIADLGALWAGQLPTLLDAIARGALGPSASGEAAAAPSHRLADIQFDLPIPNPPKFLLVGRNYVDHVAEGKNTKLPTRPGLFMRALNTLVPHDGAMVLPKVSDGSFDYEGELAFVIGRTGRYVSKSEALSHVFGYTCFNDGSMREFQENYQVIVGKNFPNTGGFGPWLVTADEIPDPSTLTLSTRLNGQTVQQSSTAKMIFDIPTIIEYISVFNTLQPGDIVATGTPDGVGKARSPQLWMKPGDVIEVEISGIGTLRNRVVAEEA